MLGNNVAGVWWGREWSGASWCCRLVLVASPLGPQHALFCAHFPKHVFSFLTHIKLLRETDFAKDFLVKYDMKYQKSQNSHGQC